MHFREPEDPHTVSSSLIFNLISFLVVSEVKLTCFLPSFLSSLFPVERCLHGLPESREELHKSLSVGPSLDDPRQQKKERRATNEETCFHCELTVPLSPPALSFFIFVIVPSFVRLATTAAHVFNTYQIVRGSSVFSLCVQNESCGLRVSWLVSRDLFRWYYLGSVVLILLTVSTFSFSSSRADETAEELTVVLLS